MTSDIERAPWTADDALPEWARSIPGPDLALAWTAMITRETPGMEMHAWRLGPSDAPEALACVHVLRGLDLAGYIGGAAQKIAAGLGRIGWHPLRMDIAFVELPLLHLPGFSADPALDAERRLALFEAMMGACRGLGADLVVARVLPGTPETHGSGLPLVPFMANHIIPLDPERPWRPSLVRRWRKKLGQLERRMIRGDGSVRIHRDELPDAERMFDLYRATVQRHEEGLQHPIQITKTILRALAELPRAQRFVVGVYVRDELAVFCLCLITGGGMLLRTTGVDRPLSRPVHGYTNSYPPPIELAERLGCDHVDLGPTTEDGKRRLGAHPISTSYLVDVRSRMLRPVVGMVARRFANDSITPALPEGAAYAAGHRLTASEVIR